MITKSIKLVTRPSRLACWQAEHTAMQLRKHHPHLSIDIIKIKSEGDINQHSPIQAIGGKTTFVKTLQQQLLDHKADIAVHSAKDLAVHSPAGIVLGCLLAREEACDVLIANEHLPLHQLTAGSRIGTSSPRRKSQLLHQYPNLVAADIRGNIETRLNKLHQKKYDAIILALAGIKRLGLETEITCRLDKKIFVPAIGQGAIAIECRSEDVHLQNLLKPLEDKNTRLCVSAEQAVNQILGGDCHSPIAAHAELDLNLQTITLQAMVGEIAGPAIIQFKKSTRVKNLSSAQELGVAVAHQLIEMGAKKLWSA